MVSLTADRSSFTALSTLRAASRERTDIQTQLSTGLKIDEAKDNAAFFLVANTTRSDSVIIRGIRDNLSVTTNGIATALAGIEAIQRNVDNIRDAIIVAQQGDIAIPQLSQAVEAQVESIEDIIDGADFAGTNYLKAGNNQTIVSGLDRSSGGFSFDTLDVNSAALDNRPLDLFLNGEGYLETGGELVFEAENYYVDEAGDGHFWETAASRPGFIRVDDGGNQFDIWTTEARVENDAPEVRYRATLQNPGTYYVWVRGVADASPRGNSDSIHIGLNGQRLTGDGGVTGFGSTPTWGRRDTYTGQAVRFDVSAPGVYDINIWAREDGVAIDKIILTQDASYVPTGTGPAENQFVTPGADYLMDPTEGEARREAAGFIELIERVLPEEAAVNFRTALILLDSAQAKLNRAAAGLGATKSRIERQQTFLTDLDAGLGQAVGALVDAELDELSSQLLASQVREQFAINALSNSNERKALILKLF